MTVAPAYPCVGHRLTSRKTQFLNGRGGVRLLDVLRASAERQHDMQVQRLAKRGGVTINLEPEECALLVKLAQDAATASQDAPEFYQATGLTYFNLSLNIGRRISALLEAPADRQGTR